MFLPNFIYISEIRAVGNVPKISVLFGVRISVPLSALERCQSGTFGLGRAVRILRSPLAAIAPLTKLLMCEIAGGKR